MSKLKTALTEKLQKTPLLEQDLPERDYIILHIAEKIEEDKTATEKQEKQIQDQLEKSRLQEFQNTTQVATNLVVNEGLRQQIFAEREAQETQTIAQLQVEHEARQQAEAQKKQQTEARRQASRKKSSKSKLSARDALHPARSLTKKVLGKIPIVGGIAAAGVGLVGLVTLLQ